MQTTSNYGLKKPDGTDPVDIADFNENANIIDAELKKRPTSTGNASDMVAGFSQASARANLVSGETLKTTFGKIMKWFADLKTGAFATVANNDTTTAAGYVADARAVKVHGDEIDTLDITLSAHKSGADHDSRYYTKWESDDSVQYLSKQINSQYETLTNRLMPTAGLAVNTGASGGYAYCDKYDRVVVTRICLSIVNKTGAFTNYSLANLPYTANGLAVGLVTSQNKGITFPVIVSENSNVLVLENKAVTPASNDWLWGNIVYISK